MNKTIKKIDDVIGKITGWVAITVLLGALIYGIVYLKIEYDKFVVKQAIHELNEDK